MKHFLVSGANKSSGTEQQLIIEADDAGQAEQIAGIRGIFVSSVRAADPAPAKAKRDKGPAIMALIAVVLGIIITGIAVWSNIEKDETYQGKSTTEWLVLASDNDSNTRGQAIEALSTMKSSKAREAVRRAALTDSWWKVRAVALYHCYSLTEDEQLKVLESLLKDAEPYNTKPVTCDAFIYRAEALGPKAAKLAPGLRKLREEIRKNGSDDVANELITECIGAIEGKPKK